MSPGPRRCKGRRRRSGRGPYHAGITPTATPELTLEPSVPQLPGRRVDLSGRGSTCVLEAGPKSGRPGRPALLLLHGWMATAALNWYNAVEALGQEFRVVAPDLRGHGRYGDGAPRFTVEGCVDDVAALVGQLCTGPVIAVGYSMGGAVAQVLARRHPAVVRGMVLCATAATFAELTWLRPAVRVTGRLTGGLARHWPARAQSVLRHQIARRDAAGESGGRHHAAWALEDRACSSLACFIEAGAVLNGFDSRPWLHELDLPTAVVVTTDDTRVPPWRQDTLTALIPGAERFTVGAGHDAAAAHRDVFLPVLRQACLTVAGEVPSRLPAGPP